MINNISIVQDCYNCGACYNSCPRDAISIEEKQIFYKVKVNFKKCINCGICLKNCPSTNKSKIPNNPISAYGAYAMNDSIRKNSSSGGMFYLLSAYVLNNGGVVYSAVLDNGNVIFSSSDLVDLTRFQKSKYVESNVGFVFRNIKNDLKNHRLVLFCGTPCQNAGLNYYLGNENIGSLFKVDFACGGLPSHYAFKKYIEYLEIKNRSALVNIDFRPKVFGWSLHTVSASFRNRKRYRSIFYFDPFMYPFLVKKLSVRDACYSCRFRNSHYSDITIADFWKYKTISKLENDEKGISLLLINTDKGSYLFSRIKASCIFEKIDLNKALYNNLPFEKMDTITSLERSTFFDVLEKRNIKEASIKIGMKHGFVKTLLLIRLSKMIINNYLKTRKKK